MGKLRMEKIDFSEKSIQRALNLHYLSDPRYLIHNLFVFEWESDYLAKTKSGYWYEVEIKISLADFKNDFKKKDKHEILKNGRCWDRYWATGYLDKLRPNYFAYCVPEPLVPKVEALVPEYAGLFGVDEHGFLVMHKACPKLHGEKLTDEQLKLAEKFYYNWVEEKRKNREHDQIVRDFRNEIQFLKDEFKAVTGRDVYDY
ncbi:MAG: hypothetical protein J5951_06085 [Bacteroidales bacterium]|nr:hypothetical protein [Bacteroidales bacterium]